MAIGRLSSGTRERAKHLLWASVIACLLMTVELLMPLDQMLWSAQARLAPRDASGQIVFVSSSSDLADPQFPERRTELAKALETLREAGVEKVFVDVVFDRATDPRDDDALNRELRSWNGRAMLVDRITDNVNGREVVDAATASIARGVPSVPAQRTFALFGSVWESDSRLPRTGPSSSSLPTVMAGITPPHQTFRIYYGFRLNSIPAISLSRISDKSNSGPALLGTLAGKTAIIGINNREVDAPFNIPGHLEVPGSIVHIYAAETLISGLTRTIGPFPILAAIFVLLGLTILLGLKKTRSIAYANVLGLLLIGFLVTSGLGIYMSASAALALVAIYAALRFRARWQKAVRLVDEATGLPTFTAMEADKAISTTAPTIIVARIHRFEEVKRTLPVELHGEYLKRIVDRLRAARPDETIYAGPGHLIAWVIDEKEPSIIREHLEGLRALFTSPLQVGSAQVDVGITFGVDVGTNPVIARRVANAVSAAEATNETYDPINVAEPGNDEDLMWNISLQARIDAAMENGEIYLIYQPKVLVKSGEMVGVEALVRWRDPERGLIPPDNFIKQCENVGRMSHLTRHVLREACLAGNAFGDLGMQIPIAVNISATLLHEDSIVTMVREILAETGFEPRQLTLEVTETYRISNLDRARDIIEALAALGCKISMDDFGVGAASLEALMQLPFDELKIDRTFTSAIARNDKAAGIVRNVLKLGRDLQIVVVAEGVEDQATLSQLEKEGCLVAQGFAISRPKTFKELTSSPWFRPEKAAKNMV